MSNTVEGFYYLTHKSGETLCYHCSKCGVAYIIGDDQPPSVFCCGKRVPLPDQEPQPTGLLAFFSSGPAPLPRVRFKAQPVRPLMQREEIEETF
jgi:hypothetical protein